MLYFLQKKSTTTGQQKRFTLHDVPTQAALFSWPGKKMHDSYLIFQKESSILLKKEYVLFMWLITLNLD